jgi:hypothetical protein
LTYQVLEGVESGRGFGLGGSEVVCVGVFRRGLWRTDLNGLDLDIIELSRVAFSLMLFADTYCVPQL